MGDKRSVKSVSVVGAEKRYRPNKHYVFVLQVSWTDGTEYIIYRKYSHFYELHTTLMDTFPIEAGIINEEERTIPLLPGRKLFGRSEVKRVATERSAALADYLQALAQLPAKLSQHQLVSSFFRAKPSDINPPKNACVKPEGLSNIFKTALGGSKDRSKSPIEEDEGQLSISDPMPLESYHAIADYKAQEKTEVSLTAGQLVDVVDKNESGWWFVQTGTSQGWAPASYLDPEDQAQEMDDPEPDYSGELFMVLGDYKADMADEVSLKLGSTVQVLHKLLDGWWVVSYNGEVGYAPATYLTPYMNPYLRATVEDPMDVVDKRLMRKPTKRRCTIKATSGKWKSRPQRDLTIYRKMSTRRTVKKHVTAVMPPSMREKYQLEKLVNDGYEVSLSREDTDAYENDVMHRIANEAIATPKMPTSDNGYEAMEPEDGDYEEMDDSSIGYDQVPVHPPAMTLSKNGNHTALSSVSQPLPTKVDKSGINVNNQKTQQGNGYMFNESKFKAEVRDPNYLGDLPHEHAPLPPKKPPRVHDLEEDNDITSHGNAVPPVIYVKHIASHVLSLTPPAIQPVHTQVNSGDSSPQRQVHSPSGNNVELPRTPEVVRKKFITPKTPEVVRKNVTPPKTPEVMRKNFIQPKTPEVMRKNVTSPKTPEVMRKNVTPPKAPEVMRKNFTPPKTPEMPRRNDVAASLWTNKIQKNNVSQPWAPEVPQKPRAPGSPRTQRNIDNTPPRTPEVQKHISPRTPEVKRRDDMRPVSPKTHEGQRFNNMASKWTPELPRRDKIVSPRTPELPRRGNVTSPNKQQEVQRLNVITPPERNTGETGDKLTSPTAPRKQMHLSPVMAELRQQLEASLSTQQRH